MNISERERTGILEMLDVALVNTQAVCRSEFHKREHPVLHAEYCQELHYLKTTMKNLHERASKYTPVERVWALWFMEWGLAMMQRYSISHIYDDEFREYCDGLRALRDARLHELNQRVY